MNVLMIGVDKSTKGGMWTVVENYLNSKSFVEKNNLTYIPTSITGCSIMKRLMFTLSAYLRIIKSFKKTNYSILHVHMSERASIIRKGIVMMYAKKHGAKIILHMHGAEFEVLYKMMSNKKKAFVRKIVNMADRVIILGEYWRNFICGLVDDPQKVCVVHNAVSVPNEYKYNVACCNILFLGAISKRKGIDILLEALKNQNNILHDKCIVNIYGPDIEGNINDRINENGLSKWVKYHGWLDEKHKQQVLASSSINILPSYNEGLPMTILEAMSYGIPSITTSVAAIPEVVNDGNGIVIEPGDIKGLENAIQLLVLNNEYRYKLSRKAYEDAVEKFSLEKHISQIQEIYKELIL